MKRPVHLIFLLALGTVFAPAAPVSAQTPTEGDIIISEIMHSPDGPDTNREYFEVFNTTNRTIDLENWVIVEGDPTSSNTPTDDIDNSVRVPPGSFAVFCENDTESENGGVTCDYDYADDIDHIGSEDHVGLRYNGTRIDLVHYDDENGWPDAFDASIEYVGTPDGDNNRADNWETATQRVGEYAESSGANDGSPGVDAPDGSLPVELTQFQATAEGTTARLTWATASETDNAGFVVQHRPETTATWARLGFVDGAGTTTAAQSYRFDTEALTPGRHAFRLKQVDTDGTAHYSAPTRVQVQGDFGLTLEGPNPLSAGEQVRVRFRAPQAPSPRLVLYNVLGQRVRTIASDPEAGGVRVRLSADELASGTYFLRAEGASQTATRRLTVVR